MAVASLNLYSAKAASISRIALSSLRRIHLSSLVRRSGLISPSTGAGWKPALSGRLEARPTGRLEARPTGRLEARPTDRLEACPANCRKRQAFQRLLQKL